MTFSMQKPECHFGYTDEQLKEMFGPTLYISFWHWMKSKPYVVCDGLEYDPDYNKFTEVCKIEHGDVVKTTDVELFCIQLGELEPKTAKDETWV